MLKKKSKGLTFLEILIAMSIIALCILTITFTYIVLFTNQNKSFYINLINRKIELYVRKNPNINSYELQQKIDNDKDINIKVQIISVEPNDDNPEHNFTESLIYHAKSYEIESNEIKEKTKNISQKIKEVRATYKLHNQKNKNEVKVYIYYINENEKVEVKSLHKTSGNSVDIVY